MEHNTFEAAAKKEMISRTFHLDTKQIEPMQKISKQLGISQSELVRRAITLYLEEYSKFSGKKGKAN